MAFWEGRESNSITADPQRGHPDLEVAVEPVPFRPVRGWFLFHSRTSSTPQSPHPQARSAIRCPHRCHMAVFRKQGKQSHTTTLRWFADWKDEHGKRKRKAFLLRKDAANYAEKMQHEARIKKAQASAKSANSRRRGRKAAKTATHSTSRDTSRAASATSKPKHSRRRKQTRSSHRGARRSPRPPRTNSESTSTPSSHSSPREEAQTSQAP